MQERPRDRHIRQPPLEKVCMSDGTNERNKSAKARIVELTEVATAKRVSR